MLQAVQSNVKTEAKNPVKTPVSNRMKNVKEKHQTVKYEEWANTETGEIRSFAVSSREVYQDTNFYKIFLGDLAKVLKDFGGRKFAVLIHILEKIDSQNRLISTYETIMQETKSGKSTVSAVINYLKEIDFLREEFRGVYMVSPQYLVQGGHKKRMGLMVKYQNMPYSEKEAAEKDRQLNMF
jgi:hypothetical protein